MIRDRLTGVVATGAETDPSSEEVEKVAESFGAYLHAIGRTAGSKHAALGAVGKALRAARTLRGDALLGYARRLHEQTTENSFPAGAVEKLDEGLAQLNQVLKKLRGRAGVRFLDSVQHATYFDVRRRFVEFQRAWRAYAAGEGKAEVDDVPWLSKKLDAEPQWAGLKKSFLESRANSAPADLDWDGERQQ